MGDGETTSGQKETLADFSLALRELRRASGLSYRSIAGNISAQREAEGLSPAAAAIAHSTVSDAFREGRSRVNPVLVEEIVRALGVEAEEAALWRARCVAAMGESAENGARSQRPVSLEPRESPTRNAAVTVTVIVLGGVLLNATGKFVNPLLGDVLFFDMIGTATVALLLGPWWAALSGVLFMVVELMKGNVGDALFAVTMVTSGLIWGYGAKRFGLGETLPRFLGLSVIVAVATSLVAVPITVFYFSGEVGRGADGFIASVSAMGVNLWAAVGGSNLAVSLVDKVLTGAAAFYLARLFKSARARA